jgi:hypothetical protein
MELTDVRTYYELNYTTVKKPLRQRKTVLADTEEQAVTMLRYLVADWDNDTVDQIISTLCIHK